MLWRRVSDEAEEGLEMLSENRGSKRSGGCELDLECRKKLVKQIRSSSCYELAKVLERIVGIFPHRSAIASKRLISALGAE